MDDNFMRICDRLKPETARRWVSILMMISLLAGSVSIASFAKGEEKAQGSWEVGIDVSRRTKTRTGRTGAATPSELSLTPATPSNATASDAAFDIYTLGELLEQSDYSGAITAQWFQVKLDNTVISNSNDYSVKLNSGTKIPPDAMMEHRLQVIIFPQQGELGDGDLVTWNLGRIEGLKLSEEVWEEMTLEGTDFGCACLSYDKDGTLWLRMEFYDEIQKFPWINVTYWYESAFIPVKEETVLEFDLPGYEETEWAVLLPENSDETSTETIEPTTPEPEPSPEETTGEETTGKEPPGEETTAEETTKGSGSKKSSSGGSSSSVSVSATTAAEITAAEESTSAVSTDQESDVQTQEPEQGTLPDTGNRPEKNGTSGRNSGSKAAKTAKSVSDQITGQQTQQQQEDFLTLDIIETAGGHNQMMPGELIVYRMAVRNEGAEMIKDIRVRDYLPDYTSFVAVEDGSYGVINGRQHVTWMLDLLKPGEEKELVLSVRVFPCVPENHRIENKVYWQADNKTQINDPENPSEVKTLPEIIVG